LGWVVLIGLSRMFLGRHFLADVLGGLALGSLAAVAAYLLLRPAPGGAPAGERRGGLVAVCLLAAGLAAAAPFVAALDPDIVGALAGVALALAFLRRRGFPADGGSPGRRAARVAVGLLGYLALQRGLEALFAAAGLGAARSGRLALAALVTAGAVLLAVAASRRLRLYQTTPPGVA
jgi:hypothetical protein